MMLRADAAVQYIDVEGTPDMSLFVDEAQVAESVASILSVLRESVTPRQLFEILEVNLKHSEAIFGSAIAFEPDSYPWFEGQVDVDAEGLRYGVPSGGSNSSLWEGQSEPWTLPKRLLWPNESNQTAVLYCPYVARGNIRTAPVKIHLRL